MHALLFMICRERFRIFTKSQLALSLNKRMGFIVTNLCPFWHFVDIGQANSVVLIPIQQ